MAAAFTIQRQQVPPLFNKVDLKQSDGDQAKNVIVAVAVGAIKILSGLTATVASIAIIAGALVYLGLPTGTVAAATAAIVASMIAVSVASNLVGGVANVVGAALVKA